MLVHFSLRNSLSYSHYGQFPVAWTKATLGKFFFLNASIQLSGRVLDLRLKDCLFETHGQHCVVSMGKTLSGTLYPLLNVFYKQIPKHVDQDLSDKKTTFSAMF